jgi:alpha-galactosidase
MNKFHFFASSVGEWHVDSDLRQVMKYMDKRGLEYGIWYVPGDVNDEYNIEAYKPRVTGAVWLGKYQPK